MISENEPIMKLKNLSSFECSEKNVGSIKPKNISVLKLKISICIGEKCADKLEMSISRSTYRFWIFDIARSSIEKLLDYK